jgi:hypothetical protein
MSEAITAGLGDERVGEELVRVDKVKDGDKAKFRITEVSEKL